MSDSFSSCHTSAPQVRLLGDERYTVMLSNAGGGYSMWRGQAVTRWRSDPTCDAYGSYVLLRDVDNNGRWSATMQPFAGSPDALAVADAPGQVTFSRQADGLACKLEVAAVPTRSGEVRRMTVTNSGKRVRTIELISYAELVLGSARGDASHPAFSKMFVQTEVVDDCRTLLANRRKRVPEEADIWAAHTCTLDDDAMIGHGYETDRASFLGRGRTLRDPAALDGDQEQGHTGTVLDPIFSLRRTLRIEPGACVACSFWTLLGADRNEVLALARTANHPDAAEQAFAEARDSAEKHTRAMAGDTAMVARMHDLAAAVLYPQRDWRAAPERIACGRGGQPTLWPHAISGDRPIVLVHIEHAAQLPLLREVLQAQAFWRARQLVVDVVIMAGNSDEPELAQELKAVADEYAPDEGEKPALFVLHDKDLDAAAKDTLATAAMVVVEGGQDGLEAQVKARQVIAARTPEPTPTFEGNAIPSILDANRVAGNLDFFNGHGGFSRDGREYITVVSRRHRTPAPWLNVIANEHFGFTVTTDGGGYSFGLNSQLNQISAWSNDAVSDPPGEVIYLQDADDGTLWSATPLPMRDPQPYVVHHSAGYTRFEHDVRGIASDLTQFIAKDDPVKISRLRLHNHTDRPRRIKVTAYIEWVLGATGRVSKPYVVTSRDEASGALLACNQWRIDFAPRTSFLALSGDVSGWTCDRTEFIGRNGALDCPVALLRGQPMSASAGAGLDPCAALQSVVELAPGAETELVILLGEGADAVHARDLLARYREQDLDSVFAESVQRWDELCAAVQVQTPDQSMNLLLNRWLPYQVLSCRVWARTAFYQAGGAFGFRDQLQDVLALCLSRPQETRAHLLRSAAHQFVEGDVQHWWLPPSGAGVRTHIVDDRLWLPYAVAQYIKVTGDTAVLDEEIPFLVGAALKSGQRDSFFTPAESEQKGSLFEHCARALEISFGNGAHGIPLFGSGDWNDGMNRVGDEGKGESVWMAWFLHVALSGCIPLARARGENERANRWQQHADALIAAANEHAWDGKWWRRGWYDDGTALGSADSDECRIDALAQGWSVMCGANDRERGEQAMHAVHEMLVREDGPLVALFTPAFDKTAQDPGYIKGYPPGIRENGGQYTHGVIWSAVAFAELGDGDKAGELFSIFNPIRHGDSEAAIARYKVEPYVEVADVYTASGHVGRGGWSWYTGSSGWLYRCGLEWLLGLRVRGDSVRVEPCIPHHWPGFSMTLRHRTSRYEIRVDNPEGVCSGIASIELDGTLQKDVAAATPLVEDGATHRLRIVLGAPRP